MRRNRKTEAPTEAPPSITLDIPVLPTDIQIGRLDVGETAYAILKMDTVLVSGTYVIDRGQAINLGSQLLKLAEKMPRQPEPKKLHVPDNAAAPLVVVEDK